MNPVQRARLGLHWPVLLLVCIGSLLVGCGKKPTPTITVIPTITLEPSPTPKPSATATSIPTLTPTPTPTPTPIPPIYLTAEVPKPVTALEPVPIEVWLEEPDGIETNVQVSARVIDGQDQLYATFERFALEDSLLTSPEENDPMRVWHRRYVADGWLQLPLEPAPGVWHLIVDIQADLPIKGYRDRVFTPAWVPYHGVSETLPIGVDLHVPQAFSLQSAQGGPIAGGRSWRYRKGEVALFWAPGPTERLFYDNALVMVEATYDPEYQITLERVEETSWGDDERSVFIFYETWRAGTTVDPAEALVLQGPDYRLYVLRVRGLEGSEIPSLMRDVRDTFRFVEPEGD